MDGRKRKGRLLKRVSFSYLNSERRLDLFDINFDAENQDDIARTVKKLSELMRERNIELSKSKELLKLLFFRILNKEIINFLKYFF